MPCWETDILIGYKYGGYHPVREQSSDYLLVLVNIFGRSIGSSRSLLDKVIQHIFFLHLDKVSIEDFYETEAMSEAFAPKLEADVVENAQLVIKHIQ